MAADHRHRPLIGLLLLLLLPLLLAEGARPAADREAEEEDVTDILRRTAYNRLRTPTQSKGRPTTVAIQMYIEGMSSFRAQTMDFQLDIYFQQMWLDDRLVHNNSRRILVKDKALFGALWQPDVFFANSKVATFHEVTQPNFLVWIYPNGTVWYDARISLTVICMQNLMKYPLDSQSCTLRILSYAYDTDELTLEWIGTQPIETNEELRMTDMRLRSIVHSLRNDTYATGVWSCATAEFTVDRDIMHHIIQSYLPTTLIVVISWFSFWLDVDAVPGRVSLSITTLLTLTTHASAARMSLPQASYVKAIDVWLGTCTAFVFLAMIEFTAVNYATRRKPHRPDACIRHRSLTTQIQQLVQDYNDRNKRANASYEVAILGGSSSTPPPPPKSQSAVVMDDGDDEEDDDDERGDKLKKRMRMSMRQKKRRKLAPPSPSSPFSSPLFRRTILSSTRRLRRVELNRQLAQAIDRRSRTLFPLAFFLFTVTYWIYYTQLAADHRDDGG